MISLEFGQAALQDILKQAEPVKGESPEVFITSAEFASLTFSHKWLVEDVIVEGEPVVVGGPKKSLKTSISLDLAISLAAGFNTRFLGKFNVPVPVRVGVISGESGPATLQKKAKEICTEKNLEFQALTNLLWMFSMPQLGTKEGQAWITKAVQAQRLKVLIIDPVYIGLLAGNDKIQAGNVMQMGPLLKQIVDSCLPFGCTPIFVHHTHKLGKTDMYSPIDLDHLSQSGFAEFARQWILLSRRSEFDSDAGVHELWMKNGGSAGHSRLWAVDITEGRMSSDFSGQKWKILIRQPKQLKLEKAAQKESQQQKKTSDAINKNVSRVIDVLSATPDGETKSVIGNKAKLNSKNLALALKAAINQGRVEECQIAKNNTIYDGYKISDQSDTQTDSDKQ